MLLHLRMPPMEVGPFQTVNKRVTCCFQKGKNQQGVPELQPYVYIYNSRVSEMAFIAGSVRNVIPTENIDPSKHDSNQYASGALQKQRSQHKPRISTHPLTHQKEPVRKCNRCHTGIKKRGPMTCMCRCGTTVHGGIWKPRDA